MIIEPPKDGFIEVDKIKTRLELLVSQPDAGMQAPCPRCPLTAPRQCSAYCRHAAQGLSTDPVNYPIEEHVVPLVFELTALRLFQTCWSCQGHMDTQGVLWKPPQVSFYSSSSIYPKLLLDHINALYMDRKLNYPWQISLNDFARSCDVTYTLEPKLNRDQDLRLGSLQKDLHTLADKLGDNLKNAAYRLIYYIKTGKISKK